MDEHIQRIIAAHQAAMAKQIQFFFLAVIQNSQIVHSENKNDDHMLSRCVFLMNFRGQGWIPMHADVRQAYGTDYETDPIEFTKPLGAGYDDPFPYDAFTDLVEAYYRSLFGKYGTAIKVSGGHFQENLVVQGSGPHFLPIPETTELLGGWVLDTTSKWHKPPRRKSQSIPLGEMKKELPQPNPQPSTENLERKDQ
jgi:hypothetical protein